MYNVCVENDFDIDLISSHCEVIECRTSLDCCRGYEPTGYCDMLDENCRQGDEYSCDDYLWNCVCPQACEENICIRIVPCYDDNDCGDPGSCRDGACESICEDDDDCYGDQACVDEECVDACSDDHNCPYFHRCEDNICVESGCTTDRECIAISGNPLARCQDEECSIPCENDAECNTGGSYSFQACVDGLCIHVGCETDEECRIALGVFPDSGVQAICVED